MEAVGAATFILTRTLPRREATERGPLPSLTFPYAPWPLLGATHWQKRVRRRAIGVKNVAGACEAHSGNGPARPETDGAAKCENWRVCKDGASSWPHGPPSLTRTRCGLAAALHILVAVASGWRNGTGDSALSFNRQNGFRASTKQFGSWRMGPPAEGAVRQLSQLSACRATIENCTQGDVLDSRVHHNEIHRTGNPMSV